MVFDFKIEVDESGAKLYELQDEDKILIAETKEPLKSVDGKDVWEFTYISTDTFMLKIIGTV